MEESAFNDWCLPLFLKRFKITETNGRSPSSARCLVRLWAPRPWRHLSKRLLPVLPSRGLGWARASSPGPGSADRAPESSGVFPWDAGGPPAAYPSASQMLGTLRAMCMLWGYACGLEPPYLLKNTPAICKFHFFIPLLQVLVISGSWPHHQGERDSQTSLLSNAHIQRKIQAKSGQHTAGMGGGGLRQVEGSVSRAEEEPPGGGRRVCPPSPGSCCFHRPCLRPRMSQPWGRAAAGRGGRCFQCFPIAVAFGDGKEWVRHSYLNLGPPAHTLRRQEGTWVRHWVAVGHVGVGACSRVLPSPAFPWVGQDAWEQGLPWNCPGPAKHPSLECSSRPLKTTASHSSGQEMRSGGRGKASQEGPHIFQEVRRFQAKRITSQACTWPSQASSWSDWGQLAGQKQVDRVLMLFPLGTQTVESSGWPSTWEIKNLKGYSHCFK